MSIISTMAYGFTNCLMMICPLAPSVPTDDVCVVSVVICDELELLFAPVWNSLLGYSFSFSGGFVAGLTINGLLLWGISDLTLGALWIIWRYPGRDI